MQEAEQYDVVRRRVEQRFQQRNTFYTHLAVYTLVSILLWVIYGFTAGLAGQFVNVPVLGLLLPVVSFPWPLIIMAGWGIGLVAHGLNYYIRYGEGAIRRREAIQREIERELALDRNYENPKNDSYLRLIDDGELEVIEDEADWKKKRKNH